MADPRTEDHVDRIVRQWADQRPDLDVSPMEIIGRVSRLAAELRPLLKSAFARHQLEDWEFDVLATLRRHGPPHRLTVGQILESAMVTSGTMTNRIDRLEGRGLVERHRDPDDARVVLVGLTPNGHAVVDAALADHVANEDRILTHLTEAERHDIAGALRRLQHALDALDPNP